MIARRPTRIPAVPRAAPLGAAFALLTALPLVWKWQLGLRRAAGTMAGLGLLASALVSLAARVVGLGPKSQAGLTWLATLLLAFAGMAYRFYRDPERTPPRRDGAIVSPADGEVLYVHRSLGGLLPVSAKHGRQYRLHELTRTPLHAGDAVVIGIGMSFLDVHVNRAPIDGVVTRLRHFPGRFGSLRLPEMVFENERTTTLIEKDDVQVAVVQIASRLVRQIVSFVRQGDSVAMGQRIGVIRLGSQVDLVLPDRPDLRVTVRPGDRVAAAESIVATIGVGSPAALPA